MYEYSFGSIEISIHALREEGDSFKPSVYTLDVVFLSTPSARRATICRAGLCHRW